MIGVSQIDRLEAIARAWRLEEFRSQLHPDARNIFDALTSVDVPRQSYPPSRIVVSPRQYRQWSEELGMDVNEYFRQ